MKKMLMMAIVFMASSMAFAGDSDGLKAIKNCKNYAEAAQLVQQNLASLVGGILFAGIRFHMVIGSPFL